MEEKNRIIIPIKGNRKWGWPPRSLNWDGDELVDWVGGIVRYRLDQTVIPPKVAFSYPFDHAHVSPNGEYVALVQRLGTKGIILKHGKFLREINRSFYHADDYEYPLSFLNLPDGQTGLVHCPDEYCKLEIENAETGERLTTRDTKPIDFFHSRLSVSANSQYLLSAGWIWHPFEDICIYHVNQVLSQPDQLDSRGEVDLTRNGVPLPAGFLWKDNQIIFTSSDDGDGLNEEDDDDEHQPRPNVIAKYDLAKKKLLSQAKLQEAAGILFPIDDHHVLGTYDHVKLINIETGEVVIRWKELKTSKQASCIAQERNLLPPIATDPANKRFAIASAEEITVITLGS